MYLDEHPSDIIDVGVWEPYLEAFTKVQEARVKHDPEAMTMHRKAMLRYLEASPDFWRGSALRLIRKRRLRMRVI